MRRPLSIVLLIIAIGVSIWFAIPGPNSSRSPESEANRTAEEGSIEESAEAPIKFGANSPEPSGSSTSPSPSDVSEETSTIRVHVLDPLGAPVVGAEVHLQTSRGRDTPREIAASDERGIAHFSFEEARAAWGVRTARSETYTAVEEWFGGRMASPGSPLDLYITVRRGGVLRGTVVREDGSSVPFATVSAWFFGSREDRPEIEVTADRRGEFEIAQLANRFALSARTDSLATLWGLRGTLEDGEVAEGLEIVVAETWSAEGTVLDPDGAPVSGVELEIADGLRTESSTDGTSDHRILRFRGGRGRAVTDSAGRFSIDHLARIPQTVTGHHSPYLAFRETVRPDAPPIEIILNRGESLRGVVYTKEGRPAVGARVQWGPHYGNLHSAPATTLCDEQGRFEFWGLSARNDLWVAARHEGFAMQLIEVFPYDLNPPPDRVIPPDDVVIQLEAGFEIGGSVVKSDGTSVPGARVQIVGDRTIDNHTRYGGYPATTWEYLLERHETKTDAAGRFNFEELYEGEFEVRVFDPDNPDLKVTAQAAADTPDLVITLEPDLLLGVAIRGVVRDRLTGRPIPSFQIIAHKGSMGAIHSFEGPSGEFEILGLDEGELSITARAKGYAEVSQPPQLFEHGDHDVNFELFPERSLELIVNGFGSGTSLEFSAVDEAGKDILLPLGPATRMGSLRITEERTSIGGLPAGAVTITLAGPGLPKVHKLDLTADREHALEIDLSRATPETSRFHLLFGSELPEVTAPKWILPPGSGGEFQLTFGAELPEKIDFELATMDGIEIVRGGFEKRSETVWRLWTAKTRGISMTTSEQDSDPASLQLLSISVPIIDCVLVARAEGFEDQIIDLTELELSEQGGSWLPLLWPPR